jgi:two-component system sensor histidine kinase BaeS
VFKSVRSKLFISFLLTTLLVVLAMALFMRSSLDRGFNHFIEHRQKEHITSLVDSLSEYYALNQSWDMLANNKSQWANMLWQNNPHFPKHPPPWLTQHPTNEPANAWPPQLPDPHNNRRIKPLELSVMLLRADHSIIFGRAELVGQLKLYAIPYQGQNVGYLGVLPGLPITQLIELEFIEQQSQAFLWLVFIAILLSAGLALLLAYALGRPLKRITAAAKALAIGQYDIRLAIESKDELGQLARDFNDMAAALAQAEQTRKRWVADISHELRTPLALLRGELEALQDGIRPLSRDAVDSLLADVMRLYRLTEDLYQLSLSDQGTLSYRKTEIDPLLLLQDDLTSLMPEFTKKQLRVRFNPRLSTPVLIYADPDRLSQLFRNLLTNSINYTEAGGELQIDIYQQHSQLIIVFNDSEPGVSADDMAHLFDRFYRVETSRNRHLGGAGLGLAICQNIIHAHNGKIWATPSPLNGLAIYLELPINL